VALTADKGPFTQAGGTDGTTGAVPDAARTPPFSFGQTFTQMGTGNSDTTLLSMANDQWRPYNSRNHSQEGQNVLFQDSHVEFVKKPIVGVNYDNIYTIQSSLTDIKQVMMGRVPNDMIGPLTDTDSAVYP
jgi:hypothetical protein